MFMLHVWRKSGNRSCSCARLYRIKSPCRLIFDHDLSRIIIKLESSSRNISHVSFGKCFADTAALL
jgi:hypothetical protein